MTDPALTAIENLPSDALSFGWLRNAFMFNDPDVWKSLDRGRAVLGSFEQLDQYLWTHGLMVQAQWRHVVSILPNIEQPVRLIDYGCGQGIGGLLISELSDGSAIAETSEFILIEPSSVALARAEAIYRKLSPGSTVRSLALGFDDITSGAVETAADGSTLHLFSNTLDVDGYDPVRLLNATLRPGRHTILAVSQHREYPGGTPRFRRTKAAFEHPDMFARLTIKRSHYEEFKCGPGDKWDAVVWLCDLEVHDDRSL